jgi:FlaA1/EpsC-like NDP-sugar epimerase
MIRLRHKLLIHMFRLFDQLVMLVTAAAIVYLRPEMALQGTPHILQATFQIDDVLGLLILIVVWVAIFDYCIRYKADRLVAFNAQLLNLVKATSLASLTLIIISVVFTVHSLNPLNILIFFVVVTAIGVMGRLLLRALLLSARRSGYNYRFLLVVGANERARQITARIEQKPELGYKIVGFVSETPEALEEWNHAPHGEWRNLGLINNLRDILIGERVDEIIVCLPVEARFSDIAAIIKHARDLGIVVRLMPDFEDGNLFKNLHIEEFEGNHVVTLFREQMLLQLLLKRLLDASLSLVIILILSPLLLLVAC